MSSPTRNSLSQKLEGTKYISSPVSPKLEGTLPKGPIGWLRLWLDLEDTQSSARCIFRKISAQYHLQLLYKLRGCSESLAVKRSFYNSVKHRPTGTVRLDSWNKTAQSNLRTGRVAHCILPVYVALRRTSLPLQFERCNHGWSLVTVSGCWCAVTLIDALGGHLDNIMYCTALICVLCRSLHMHPMTFPFCARCNIYISRLCHDSSPSVCDGNALAHYS